MTSQPDFAQDLDELFDVVNEDGSSTGITKRRADVHRDGDWHRAVHIWVWGIDDTGPYLLMNQRGRNKDTFPLALDATVGGHLSAGETVAEALREIEEEIGIVADFADLCPIGQRMRSSEGHVPGIIDREIQDIFLLRDNRPLIEFRPNPAELEGLVRLTLGNALALFGQERKTTRATRLRASDGGIDYMTLSFDSLLLFPDDDYFLHVAEAIYRIVLGNRQVSM